MKFVHFIFFLGSLSFLLGACNLDKEIDLDLPLYDGQLIVECYLEPGKPFSLLLTRSTGYFDPFSTETDQFLNETLADDAQTVEIEYAGQTYTLEQGLYFDFETQKISNYQSPDLVPESYGEDFELRIVDTNGKIITSKTQILPKIPIDSVVVNWVENDTSAFALIYVGDDPGQENYYRLMLHKSSLDSTALQSFVLSDRIVEDGRLVLGSAPDFVEGDTLITTVFHIDRSYYEFLESVQNAVIAGTSPFGTPGKLITNLEGDANAVGIFTGLSYDRVFTSIKR